MKNSMEFPTKNDNDDVQKTSDQPFDLLPQHLWEEFMAWLPPRSLIRCQSVNKSWRAHIAPLLHDPSFTAKHLRNAVSPARGRNMVFCLRTPTPIELSIVTFDGGLSGRECSFASSYLPELQMEEAKASHCDGLICIEIWNGKTVLICNPALKEWKTVSSPPCKTQNIWLHRSGIGYDSVAGEYKIVRIESDLIGDPNTLRARVYSLTSDSWTLLGTAGLDFRQYLSTSTSGALIFSKGRCYCSVFMPEYTVISFDFSREEFGVVPLPDCLQRQGWNNNLTPWKGGLAIISCFFYTNMCLRLIEIWAAGEESSIITASSWTKKHCISLGQFWGAVGPFGLSLWTEDELVGKSKDGRRISYNLRSGKFGYLAVSGLLEKAAFADICRIPCVESLISVQSEKPKPTFEHIVF